MLHKIGEGGGGALVDVLLGVAFMGGFVIFLMLLGAMAGK